MPAQTSSSSSSSGTAEVPNCGSSNAGARLGRAAAATGGAAPENSNRKRRETADAGPQPKVSRVDAEDSTTAREAAEDETTAQLEAKPALGRRRTRKTAACGECNGPCGPSCTASVSPANDRQEDCAANAFARAVQRHRAAEQENKESAEANQAKRPRLSKEGNHDGRTKSARTAKAVGLNFGKPPSWFLAAPVLGNVPLHQTHLSHIAWHRGLVWCWHCGCFATAVPNDLKKECTGPTTAGARQLKRLRLGQTPINSVNWPLAEHAAGELAA